MKAGALAESSHRVAYVLRHRFEPGERPSFTVCFLHRLHAPKLRSAAYRASAGFMPALRLSSICISQVKANFIVQLAIQPLLSEQATQPSGNHPGPAHPHSSTKLAGFEAKEAFNRR